METANASAASVTRTYRAAIRLGEDFITLEETITLPLTASDDEIQRAVDLGWRIFQAQRTELEEQIGMIRDRAPASQGITVRDPDAPASEKQRNYIVALQEDLSWSSEQLALYASEQFVDLVTMTKGQASLFIDGLKQIAEERPRYTETPHPRASAEAPAPAEFHPMTERQQRALLSLAHERNTDLDAEVQQHFGITRAELSSEQAGTLLTQWQRKR